MLHLSGRARRVQFVVAVAVFASVLMAACVPPPPDGTGGGTTTTLPGPGELTITSRVIAPTSFSSENGVVRLEVATELHAEGASGPVAWRMLWGADTLSVSPAGELSGFIEGNSLDLFGRAYLRVEVTDGHSTATRLLSIQPDLPPNPVVELPTRTGTPLPGGTAIDSNFDIDCGDGLTCLVTVRVSDGAVAALEPSGNLMAYAAWYGQLHSSPKGVMIRPGGGAQGFHSPLQIIDVETGGTVAQLPIEDTSPLMSSFSPDGRWLVASDGAALGLPVTKFHVYETDGWTLVRTFEVATASTLLPVPVFSPVTDELLISYPMNNWYGRIFSLTDPADPGRDAPTPMCGQVSFARFQDWSAQNRLAFTCNHHTGSLEWSGYSIMTLSAVDGSDWREIVPAGCDAGRCQGAYYSGRFSPSGSHLTYVEVTATTGPQDRAFRVAVVEDAEGATPAYLTEPTAPGLIHQAGGVHVKRWWP